MLQPTFDGSLSQWELHSQVTAWTEKELVSAVRKAELDLSNTFTHSSGTCFLRKTGLTASAPKLRAALEKPWPTVFGRLGNPVLFVFWGPFFLASALYTSLENSWPIRSIAAISAPIIYVFLLVPYALCYAICFCFFRRIIVKRFIKALRQNLEIAIISSEEKDAVCEQLIDQIRSSACKMIDEL